MSNKISEQFRKGLKGMVLSGEEKSAIRQSVLNFISQSPVRPVTVARPDFWPLNFIRGESNIFNQKLNYVSTTAILLILAVLVGGGIAVGAEKALPGDVLYPVKIGLNEEVRSWLSVSEEAKANWEIERAQRRLEEAEELASSGRLDTESRAVIEANFETHSERVKERISDFKNKDNFNAAVDVGSNFETSLNAHQKILAKLAEVELDVQEEVKPIAVKVKSEAGKARRERQANENRLSAKVRVGTEAAAGGKLKAAESKIKEVHKYLISFDDAISVESKTRAETKLKVAEDTVSDGRAKMETRDYGGALVLFQKSIRTAQEAKLLVEANQKLEVEIEINGDDGNHESDGDELNHRNTEEDGRRRNNE